MLVGIGIDNHCSKLTGRQGRTPRLEVFSCGKGRIDRKMPLKVEEIKGPAAECSISA